MKKGIHIVTLKKQKEYIYVTILLFILYSRCFYIQVLTTIQLIFKNKEIKSYASGGIRTRNPWVLRLRNTCTIGCAKKTAENAFNSRKK